MTFILKNEANLPIDHKLSQLFVKQRAKSYYYCKIWMKFVRIKILPSIFCKILTLTIQSGTEGTCVLIHASHVPSIKSILQLFAMKNF